MPHAVRFRLDDAAVAALDALRGKARDAGSDPGRDRPQVTVAAAGTIPAPARDALADELRLIALPTLWLAALSSLPGDDEYLVLAAVTDPEVLAVHACVHDALAGRVRSPQAAHLPGSWLPHCVLVRTGAARAFAALHPVSAVRARITAVELHDTRTGAVDVLRSTTSG